MKYIHSKHDMPQEPHYAIIEFGSVTIPGDERSRQCPGHGYPEHTECTATYMAFTNEDEWKSEIRRKTVAAYPENFVALRVTPATIRQETVITIEP